MTTMRALVTLTLEKEFKAYAELAERLRKHREKRHSFLPGVFRVNS